MALCTFLISSLQLAAVDRRRCCHKFGLGDELLCLNLCCHDCRKVFEKKKGECKMKCERGMYGISDKAAIWMINGYNVREKTRK
jgi:hypothetical protein